MGKDRYLTTMYTLWREEGKFTKELASAISSAEDLKTCYNVLLRVKNVGKFFAWQVLCDLIESRVVPYTEDDWVQLGPGAIGGLKAIFGTSVNKNSELLKLAILLREMQDGVFRALELSFPRFIGRDITLKNIEHALCEFCKYTDNHVMRRYNVGGKGSRSLLDAGKSCQFCNSMYDDCFRICDLCRAMFCRNCCESEGNIFMKTWLCNICIHLESEGRKDVI